MAHSQPAPLLDRWTAVGLWVALAPVLTWSAVSLTHLTHDASVPWPLAWIPAVATDGVMVVATRVCLRHTLDRVTRRYAVGLVTLGASGSIVAAGVQHYLAARAATPPPELAAALGALPSLMAVLLVHVIAMVNAQNHRHAAAAGELASADELLAQAVQRRAEAAEEARQQQVDAAHGAALTEQTRRDAEVELVAAELARRDAERARQRAARSTDAPTRPQPTPLDASVTRIDARQRSTAVTRRTWIVTRLDAGHDVTGADVKAQFPDAQNAARDVTNVLAGRDTEAKEA